MDPSTCAMTGDEYLLLNELISRQFGITFPEHKQDLLASRLRRRLQALHLPRFLDYYLRLQSERNDRGGERMRLGELVTNNETYFFRETYQFEAFFSDLEQESGSGRNTRVLCAGCSSGEEPYTLRILAQENALRLRGREIEIDAFDLDASRIEMARSAVYGRSSMRALAPEQSARYLSPETDERWALKMPYRKGIRFAWGNILEPATYRPAARYDAIFCRNVLIYFSEAALRSAVRHFAEALRPGGLLFLGSAESIIGLSDQFETVRLSRSIAYRRVAR